MKKINTFVLIAVFFISCIYTSATAAPIYSSVETVVISDSVTLMRVQDFYSGHTLTYSVIKADLSDKNTSLKLLKSEKGTDIPDTVSNLVKTDSSAVAALNADFFSYANSKTLSLGIEIKDGKLLQSPINPSTMATVYSINDSVAMSYLDFHIMAVAPNGEYSEIRHLNKHTAYYGDILMYTDEFNGGMSPAPGGEVCEVVVEDGKIKEFRRNMPPAKIPQNGCVLVVSEGVSMFLANNFNTGDEIRFDYYITPDISNADAAFGGGAMLVSDGKVVTDFSHVISGYQPRSAIGTDKSAKTVYLVAVDGRQSSSRGVTMAELASLMASLGCHNAVNLDGGGSTNMVASTVTNPDMHTVNSPTENRRVSNAVGISFDSADTSISSIYVDADRDVVFPGGSVKITATPLNSDKRPVPGNVTLSSENGTFYSDVFVPDTPGIAKITARCDNIEGTHEIYVIDKVSGINLKNYISMNPGESRSLDIIVYDSEGRNVSVEDASHFEITSSDEEVVSVAGQTLTAHKNGTAVISVRKDGAESFSSVTVGKNAKKVTDSFDSLSGKFSSYPDGVKGNVELSTGAAYQNASSLKLSYDFSEDDSVSKAVYYSLSPRISIDPTCESISLKCFSDEYFPHSIRAQLTDSTGEIFRITFGEKLKAGTWHNLSASIPSNAALPVTLDKIYVLYSKDEPADTGCVYIDDLSYLTPSSESTKFVSAPKNVYITNPHTSTGFIFRAGALSFGTKTMLTSLNDINTADTVSKANSYAMLGNLKPGKNFEDEQAIYIHLNTSKGGIRATDSSQWDFIANSIAYSSKENVFILSDYSVFGNDAIENEVIKEYLSSLNKNVFVITGGERNTYTNINGVGYFTIANMEMDMLSEEKLKNCMYLEFSLNDTPSFSWKNVY